MSGIEAVSNCVPSFKEPAVRNAKHILYMLAHDGYVPRQFSQRGMKLSFSNGIMFISFTIAQFGMFRKWFSLKEKNWQYKCWINDTYGIHP